MYTSCGRDGKIVLKDGEPDIGKRGVVLVRRDNCKYIKNVYLDISKQIFNGMDKQTVCYAIVQHFANLYSKVIPYTDLVITKSINDYGDDELTPTVFVNESGVTKSKLGNYVVPLCSTKEEYRTKLPAQIQLELRILQRGHKRDDGSRISYIVCDIGYKGKQFQKVESIDYFIKHSSVLRVDNGYYLERLIQPLDQLLYAVWGLRDYVKMQHKLFVQKSKYLGELRLKSKPVLLFKQLL
jgi:DNA polymerase elongation subunit (family B)